MRSIVLTDDEVYAEQQWVILPNSAHVVHCGDSEILSHNTVEIQ